MKRNAGHGADGADLDDREEGPRRRKPEGALGGDNRPSVDISMQRIRNAAEIWNTGAAAAIMNGNGPGVPSIDLSLPNFAHDPDIFGGGGDGDGDGGGDMGDVDMFLQQYHRERRVSNHHVPPLPSVSGSSDGGGSGGSGGSNMNSESLYEQRNRQRISSGAPRTAPRTAPRQERRVHVNERGEEIRGNGNYLDADAAAEAEADAGAGIGGGNIGATDGNYKFERFVGFQSEDFEQTNMLAGLTLQPDAAEKAHLDGVMEKLSKPGGDPNAAQMIGEYTREHTTMQKNMCRLCCIRDSEMPDLTQGFDAGMDAYKWMILYDLKYCGKKTDLRLFCECAHLFNRIQAEAIEQKISGAFMVYTHEVAEHLTSHDFSNMKRPIYHAILMVNEMIQESSKHIKGVTMDGRKVFNQNQVKTTMQLINAKIDYVARLFQANQFINVYVFGEKPGGAMIGKGGKSGAGAGAGGTSGAGGAGGAGGASRHALTRQTAGYFKKG